MKRRKNIKDRKEEMIRLRITEEHKELLSAAAAMVGLDLSAWIRFVALREAKELLNIEEK